MGISSTLDSHSAHATRGNWEPRLTEDTGAPHGLPLTHPGAESLAPFKLSFSAPYLFLPNEDTEYLELDPLHTLSPCYLINSQFQLLSLH